MQSSAWIWIVVASASAVAIAVVYTAFETVRTLRVLRSSIKRVDERLVPLLEKADVTVEAANEELRRVEGIVERFETVSGAAVGTARAVGTSLGMLGGLRGTLGSAASAVLRWRRR